MYQILVIFSHSLIQWVALSHKNDNLWTCTSSLLPTRTWKETCKLLISSHIWKPPDQHHFEKEQFQMFSPSCAQFVSPGTLFSTPLLLFPRLISAPTHHAVSIRAQANPTSSQSVAQLFHLLLLPTGSNLLIASHPKYSQNCASHFWHSLVFWLCTSMFFL